MSPLKFHSYFRSEEHSTQSALHSRCEDNLHIESEEHSARQSIRKSDAQFARHSFVWIDAHSFLKECASIHTKE